jgi:hypothetical protein
MSRLESVYTETNVPGSVPLKSVGTEKQLFPPVCLTSHWDPTAMLRLILPDQHVGLPMDFRPYVKVCKDYVTSAPAVVAPMPPKGMVFPSGGEFYPPGRYSANINNESKLHYLDRTLDRWCQTKEFIPKLSSDMYVPNVMVTRTNVPTSAFVQELAMPQAVLRETGFNCRTENDQTNWNRSPRLFSNPTKQDRYGAQTYSALPGGKLIFPHGNAVPVPLTAQAQAGAEIVGSMREFGADGRGCAVDACGNPVTVDASGNSLAAGIGPIDIPGGGQPIRVKPIRDTRPDRNVPIRGVTTGAKWAPA